MKQFLLFIFLFLFSVLFFVSCSSADNKATTLSSGNNGSGGNSGSGSGDESDEITANNLPACDGDGLEVVHMTALNAAKAIGYHEVVFFYTDGKGAGEDGLVLSDNCSGVCYYIGESNCNEDIGQVEMTGYAFVDENPGVLGGSQTLKIDTKVQITSDNFKNPENVPLYAEYFKEIENNQYVYTIFDNISVRSVTDDEGALNIGDSAVTGVTGRNLKENIVDENASYKFELLENDLIKATIVYNNGNNKEQVILIMQYIGEEDGMDELMDENTLFASPEIEDFVYNLND